MRRNTPPYRGARGRGPGCWIALACLAAASATLAGTKAPAPDGLPAGRLVFTPWFSNEVLADDNLLRRSEALNPVSDVENAVRTGVTAKIPFRMSDVSIGYEGAAFVYRKNIVQGAETHQGSVRMNLNLANRHTFVVDTVYDRGVTQVLRNENEESVRQGIPFVHTNLAVEWVREVPERPSWRARLERISQTYGSDDEELPWLDYDGWQGLYEYGQPLYRRGYLAGRYTGRRQDQFEAGPNPASEDPLRRESYDALEVGYRGLVARNQSLYLFAGYGELRYDDVVAFAEPPLNYRGPVGNVAWRLPVGARSNLNVSAVRRPLSSFYNTYYLINEVRLRFDRQVAGISRYGVDTLFSKNRYGAPTSETLSGVPTQSCLLVVPVGTDDIIRKDERKQIEGFWEWLLQPRMSMRITAGHNRRNTNCETETGSYVSNSVGVAFKLGWFD